MTPPLKHTLAAVDPADLAGTPGPAVVLDGSASALLSPAAAATAGASAGKLARALLGAGGGGGEGSGGAAANMWLHALGQVCMVAAV